MICFAHLSPMYTCVDSFNLLQHINTLIFFTWPYDISIFNRYMLYKWWLIPPAMWDAKRFEPRELTFYLWRLGSRSWASCLIATTLDATIDTDVVSTSVYNPPLTYMYVYIYAYMHVCFWMWTALCTSGGFSTLRWGFSTLRWDPLGCVHTIFGLRASFDSQTFDNFLGMTSHVTCRLL